MSKLFVKLTNNDEKHYNYQLKTGLNQDTHRFLPYGLCMPGGLYFTTIDNINVWYQAYHKHIRKVTIPDDARVYESHASFKADKIVLSEKVKYEDFMRNKRFYDTVLPMGLIACVIGSFVLSNVVNVKIL